MSSKKSPIPIDPESKRANIMPIIGHMIYLKNDLGNMKKESMDRNFLPSRLKNVNKYDNSITSCLMVFDLHFIEWEEEKDICI